jgi:hypothetical protein
MTRHDKLASLIAAIFGPFCIQKTIAQREFVLKIEAFRNFKCQGISPIILMFQCGSLGCQDADAAGLFAESISWE